MLHRLPFLNHVLQRDPMLSAYIRLHFTLVHAQSSDITHKSPALCATINSDCMQLPTHRLQSPGCRKQPPEAVSQNRSNSLYRSSGFAVRINFPTERHCPHIGPMRCGGGRHTHGPITLQADFGILSLKVESASSFKASTNSQTGSFL